MRTALMALAAVLLACAGAGLRDAATTRAAGPLQLIVTTTVDDPQDALCPDAERCSLREAIQVVNADESGDPYTILFSVGTFPADAPGTIALASPLPAVSRAAVTLDGSNGGVVIDGSALTGDPAGLAVSGAQAVIRGLRFKGFAGRCLDVSGANAAIGGDAATGQGNRFDDCGTAIAVTAPGTTVQGNRIGFGSPVAGQTPGAVGVLVSAGGLTIGSADGAATMANLIGNVIVGIQVGDGAGPAFPGPVIARNYIGRDVAGSPAPVSTGVALRQPSSGTKVTGNYLANTGVAGIQVAADLHSVSVAGNTFAGNHYSPIAGLPIDLGADGVRNPQHEGELAAGPNHFRNYPSLTRVTQPLIGGDAHCADCTVELYLAVHQPGGASDYGSEGLATTTSGDDGSFGFAAPAVAPGQWVTALVTDTAGNTSEFGPSERVGAGVVQCGNVVLQPGWNNAGYFGAEPLALDTAFPAGEGGVSAIYHLIPGTGAYTHWFAESSAGRTLTTLQPGEAYWFYADRLVTLPAGFTLTSPVPVQLHAGWNDFVYIGATADVRDTLSSLPAFGGLYRYDNDGTLARFAAYGDASTPGWARGFTEMEACRTYLLHVDADTTLTPPQP